MRPHAAIRTAGTLVLALTLAFAAGCKKQPVQISPEVASSDEALFKLGEQAIKKDQEKGLLYLRQVIDSFPKSFYAQRAKLLIADSYFNKGDEGSMILAAAEYREFIKAYPYSPSAEFRKTVADYPASDQAKTAQEKIKECEERLAEHVLGIAQVYVRQRAYKASIDRLTEVMTTYPDFTGMDQVYFTIGECYFRLGQDDQAVPYFTKLISDYPQSGLVKNATGRLKDIESRKKPGPGKAP
jgi:outer membrane protein assembly factor BamD